MTKFLRLKKNNFFEFSELDQSTEFKEFVSHVIEYKNGLIFIFNKKYYKYSKQQQLNVKSNIEDYYVNQTGWKKVTFLNKNYED